MSEVEELRQQLQERNQMIAEFESAHQRLLILGLRDCQSVTWEEISETCRHLPKFWSLPPDLRDLVVKLREERFGIH